MTRTLPPSTVRLGRYYACRARYRAPGPNLRWAKAISSPMFHDSFNYIGASVVSDDQMLPPKLRGYAPEIVGVRALTQKSKSLAGAHVLYETLELPQDRSVFRISTVVSGTLHVTVEEQNGQTQGTTLTPHRFPSDAPPAWCATKMALGRPRDWDHAPHYRHIRLGGSFVGVTNGWSLIWRRNWRKQLSEGRGAGEAVGSWREGGRGGGRHYAPSPTCYQRRRSLTAKLCGVTHIASATPVTLMKSTAD